MPIKACPSFMVSTFGPIKNHIDEEVAELLICNVNPDSKVSRKIRLSTLAFDIVSGMDTFKITGLGAYTDTIVCGDTDDVDAVPLLPPLGNDDAADTDDEGPDFNDLFDVKPKKRRVAPSPLFGGAPSLAGAHDDEIMNLTEVLALSFPKQCLWNQLRR